MRRWKVANDVAADLLLLGLGHVDLLAERLESLALRELLDAFAEVSLAEAHPQSVLFGGERGLAIAVVTLHVLETTVPS